ncbi:sporulation peptidase YabG [Clostridium fermenticellae]|uniref:Sporulation peptidase YabG n=1 Tax=Clostridium fermenticellae TaxID=2068654 RepID=A0A386H0H9_9CLOT|nr:sporulation peptidase YabG [Clostridium fermenticellae]AYD39169.1 sporulation peptidase YabG [Clostridium fermenticellae]
MKIGDIVVRKSYGEDITFKIIDIIYSKKNTIYTLKGMNLRIIADSPEEDLKVVSEESLTKYERLSNKKVDNSIKNILMTRGNIKKKFRTVKETQNNELAFGRPGRILHVDGDSDYLDICLKVYKQLMLEVIGQTVKEEDQAKTVLELVKKFRPDIVIITGHDSIIKGTTDYMNIDNYKNSKFFVETVSALRNYEANYDDLVIFAGACQSCYEAILDAGANFASSPSRVLIHCLDPVFLCEKIAYTNISNVVSIQEALENTITGTKGIGGLQTRGKYREGFPKSSYA